MIGIAGAHVFGQSDQGSAIVCRVNFSDLLGAQIEEVSEVQDQTPGLIPKQVSELTEPWCKFEPIKDRFDRLLIELDANNLEALR